MHGFRRVRFPAFGPQHVAMAVVALLLVLFAYAAAQSATQSYHLREQERALRAEVEGLRDWVSSDEYIEGVARSRFSLVRPGETLVQVDAPAAPTPPQRPGERWWEAVFGR